MIALGEIHNLFNFSADHIYRSEKIRCSCGDTIGTCKFWGPTIKEILDNQQMPASELYKLVLDSFYNYFGNDYIPVDASKSLDALADLRQCMDIEIKVIFLIRDVRPWVISMRKDRKRRNDFHFFDLLKKYGLKAPKELVFRTSFKYFWHWYLLNKKTKDTLESMNISYLQLGYEELCLYPELVTRKIADFLGLSDLDSSLLADSESHIVLGNRMRHNKEKRTRISYDNRWFCSQEWLLPSLLFPNIMKFNSREVYSNSQNHLWN